MSTTSVAAAFKDAFYAWAVTNWSGDPVQVQFGIPGPNQQDDIVGFLDVTAEQDPATFGTQRSREEVLTLIVTASSYRAGESAQEKVAWDRAVALIAELEQYARVTDTTIGGTVRECFLTNLQIAGTPQELIAGGRLVEAQATFTAHARIRS